MAKFKFKQSEIGIFGTVNSDIAVEGLEHGFRIIGLTNGKFSLIDLIHSVLKKIGKAHVVVATWSAGIKDAHQVRWMLDTDLIATMKVCTDHSYATRQPKYAVALTDLFGAENIRTAEIHAKFVLIHNEHFQVCIRTSMNLNANKTCESFEIDCDADIFAFYMNYIEHVFGSMPKGFCKESYTAGKSMDKFFGGEPVVEKQNKRWTEL